jgi:hypothetical protein
MEAPNEPLQVKLTPAPLITSKHFSNALIFDSGSLVVTRISTGIFPPFSGSRCFAGIEAHQKCDPYENSVAKYLF